MNRYRNTVVIDNFFDNFGLIEQAFKNIPLYSFDEYNKIDKRPDYIEWPGKRSFEMVGVNPFLWQLTNKEIQQKSQVEQLRLGNFRMSVNVHLRLEEDDSKDFIHRDIDDTTMIVFLSKTNLNSGLCIYDEEKQVTHDIKFIQNRAVIFDGRQYHKSKLNYGDSIDNGRLTLNCFMNYQ